VRNASSSRSTRGTERVALGFVECMAAVGFLLSVVVEGDSSSY
jgi:hypothetical protein